MMGLILHDRVCIFCFLSILAKTGGAVQTDFTQIHPALGGDSSELRGSYKKVSPEMNVSRRVDNRSTQEYDLTPSEQKVTAV